MTLVRYLQERLYKLMTQDDRVNITNEAKTLLLTEIGNALTDVGMQHREVVPPEVHDDNTG